MVTPLFFGKGTFLHQKKTPAERRGCVSLRGVDLKKFDRSPKKVF